MTERLPMFLLNTVLFPGDLLPLHVFEPRYRLMVTRHIESDPCFGVVLAQSGSEVGDEPAPHRVGTAATCVEHIQLPDGRSNLLVKGGKRFEILDSDWAETYMSATVGWLDETKASTTTSSESDAVGRIRAALDRYLRAFNQLTGRNVEFSLPDEQPIDFAYKVASALPLPLATQQQLLEAEPGDQLLGLLEDVVRHETEIVARTGAFVVSPGRPGARFTPN